MMVYETHPADSRVKEMGDICQTVTSRWGTGGGNVPIVQKAYVQSHHAQTFIAGDYAVRRLTPIECERLQGFPDDYTNIKENCPDGPRYKALGNSMAVPVMRWIGERINGYEQRGMES
jgi:DNA (cytosine-5)-methyltransferase 1